MKNKILLLILSIYFLITLKLVTVNNELYTNVINLIFWTGIIIYYIKSYVRVNKKELLYIVIILSVKILLYFFLGFIYGFNKNPYNYNFMHLLKNIIIVVIPLIGEEIVRERLLKNKNKINIIYVTILLILLEINYNNLLNLFQNKEELFKYLFSEVIYIISDGIICTFFCLNSSYIYGIVYKLFNRISIIVLPILPDIDWFMKSSINLIFTLITYYIFIYKFYINIKFKQIKFEKIKSLLVVIFMILIFCFVQGVFSYKLIAILSNSMKPVFEKGDIVIYKELDGEQLKNLKVGDIIVYDINGKYIVHRISNIVKENKNIEYQTKGDSNNVIDSENVKVEQIKGVCKFYIKYIGYPSVWLYNYFGYKDAM